MRTKVLLLILPFAIGLYGQSNLPDDFSKRLGNLLNNPQKVDSVLVADTDSVSINDSYIRQNLFLLRQDYCLFDKRKKKFYGYDGKEQFGTTYSIGVRCNGDNVLSDEAIHPWNYDSKYEQFKDNKLKPVITDSYCWLMENADSSHFTKMDTVLCMKEIIKENAVYTTPPLISNQDGFSINSSDTCKIGLMVWIVNEGGNLETDPIKPRVMYSTMRVEMLGSVDVIPPVVPQDVIGGVFLTGGTEQNASYSLAGIAIGRQGKWSLSFPFKGYRQNAAKPEKKGKLTEVKKNKKITE